MGIIVDPRYWGQGISVEAHLLILRQAFEVLGLHRIYFITSTENIPMIMFLRNTVGATHEGIMRGELVSCRHSLH